MPIQTDDVPRATARLAGALYLALVPLGIFSFAYVPSVLFAPGDVAQTVRNMVESEWLVRLGLLSHLVSQVLVVFLLLALFRLLRPVNGDRALVMLVLGLLCVPISFLSELNTLGTLHVLTGSADAAFAPSDAHAQAMLFLGLHRSSVLLAQVFWALWMLPLAALVWGSGFLPRLLALPILVAAAGYLYDSTSHVLGVGGATVAQYTALGELLLPLWLLIKGGASAPRRQPVQTVEG